MGAIVNKRGKTGISDRADRALSIAAGALSFAEGFDDVFDMPDGEVGQLIKQKAKAFKRAMEAHRVKGKCNHPLTKPVALRLPAERSMRQRVRPGISEYDQRGQVYRQRLLSDKKLLSPVEMQQARAVSRRALSHATKALRIFTVEVNGQFFYPSFFADSEIDQRILGKISRSLGNLPGWMKWDFFNAASGSLGDASPLEALRQGRVDEVERLAQALVDEIAR